MQVAAEDDKVLKSGFVSENISLPLNLTQAAGRSSLLADANMVFVQGRHGSRAISNEDAPNHAEQSSAGCDADDFAHNAKLPTCSRRIDLKGESSSQWSKAKAACPCGDTIPSEKNIEQGHGLRRRLPVPCAGRPTGRPFST